MASTETSWTMNILLFYWILTQNLKADTKGRHLDWSRNEFQRSVNAALRIKLFPYGPPYEIGPLMCMNSGGESCPLCLPPPKELWSCPSTLRHGRILGHVLSIWFLLTPLFLLLPLPMESRLWLSTVQPGWKNSHLETDRVLNEGRLNIELTGYYWGIQ